MQCVACGNEHDRAMFPAPDAVVALCTPCLESLVSGKKVKCQSCGGMTLVSRGSGCASCSTDGRKVKGVSHAETKQDKPEAG